MADIEFNDEFFNRLEKGWRIPLDGTEHDAILAVKRQFEEMGLTPDEAGIAQMVREARSAALASPDMWELSQAGGNAITYLRNPSDSNRYKVVVKSEMIRNKDHEVTLPIVYARAQEELDTFRAFGVDGRFTITWHERQDESDDPQQWSTVLP
ncbi:hypothetical protein A5676_13005 [Mycobacterium malmoense]|uniref:hypothetical protein n=1 Tax=Mycobacterium malmoense TaxID=1780 RepID=UPI00080B02BC|nr:hypothetical protein [Mycobacterium malmoense]OCB39597.1 hypothetical protein A5676_13005 [Mycobacterium malmoense]